MVYHSKAPFFHAKEAAEMLYIWLAVNVTGSIIFWLDKQRAVKRKRRIAEKTLLLWAFAGAAPGMFAVSRTIRHKIRVRKFQICLPLFSVLQLLAGFVLI
jgi:uncharacterized membrane protein YsdA (DUF1294 family)